MIEKANSQIKNNNNNKEKHRQIRNVGTCSVKKVGIEPQSMGSMCSTKCLCDKRERENVRLEEDTLKGEEWRGGINRRIQRQMGPRWV